MTDLKPISRDAIPKALEKAERYRLLNEPGEAESICRDVLRADPDDQRALVTLLLAITERFGRGRTAGEALQIVERLDEPYERAYYDGLVRERQGKALLDQGAPGRGSSAYEWIRGAMESFERAEDLRPPGNDEAILRWNACARLVRDRELGPRPTDRIEQPIE